MPTIRKQRSSSRSTTDFSGISNLPKDLSDLRLHFSKTSVHVVRLKKRTNRQPGQSYYEKEYLGRVVDGRYYSNAEYSRLFKRGDVPRSLPKKPAPKSSEGLTSSKNIKEIKEGAPSEGGFTERYVGIGPLIWKLAEKHSLLEDLQASFGPLKALILISCVIAQIENGSLVARRFEHWIREHLLPFNAPMADGELSDFFVSLGANQTEIQDFFHRRRARADKRRTILFDSTTITNVSKGIELSKAGKSKYGGFSQRLCLSLLYSKTTHEVFDACLYNGNGSDAVNCAEIMERLKLEENMRDRIYSFIMDRGYFCKANIEAASKTGGRILMAAKKQPSWVLEAIAEHRDELTGFEYAMPNHLSVAGLTVAIEPEDQPRSSRPNIPVWLHIYRDETAASAEKIKFFKQLNEYRTEISAGREVSPAMEEKIGRFFKVEQGKLVPKKRTIDDCVRNLGIFANVTNWACTAQEANELYSQRDEIEKVFEMSKEELSADPIRAHSTDAARGRAFLNALTLTVSGILKWRMSKELADTLKRTSNNEMKAVSLQEKGLTFRELVDAFRHLSVVVDQSGQSRFVGTTQTKLLQRYCADLHLEEALTEVPEYCSATYVREQAALQADAS